MCGSVTNVHKPLIGASEVARKHDAFIWQDGGALVPKDSPVARGMRDAWWQLTAWHGDHAILPLHREGNLYNFYMKKVTPAELSPADEPQKPARPVAAAERTAPPAAVPEETCGDKDICLGPCKTRVRAPNGQSTICGKACILK